MDKAYICGCGKKYGSYPAYSTHRKLKHNNIEVQGTILPSQQKAKRGRPSCQFKKLPKLNNQEKQYYQGLSIIETGLFDLQTHYKGQILNDPLSNDSTDLISELSELSSEEESENQHIQAICEFTKIMVTHTTASTSKTIVNFVGKIIEYGIQHNQVRDIQLYNNYFRANYNQMKNCELGIEFYLGISLIMSRWLFVIGKASQTLRLPQKLKLSLKMIKREGDDVSA